MKTTIQKLSRYFRISALSATLLAYPAGHALGKDHDKDDHDDKKKEKSDSHKKDKHHHSDEEKVEHKHVEREVSHSPRHEVRESPQVAHERTEVRHESSSHPREIERSHGSTSTHHSHHSDSERREYYVSRPQKSYVLSYGDGYNGRGYYYGPRGASYYYESPGITFYRERRQIPQEYRIVDESYNLSAVDARVQRALAYRGYYDGDIDGELGPASRRAIYAFQRDNGLRPTGSVSGDLLDALDIQS